MSASATANAPPTDSRAACAPDAERFLPPPDAGYVNPVARGNAPPGAPDTSSENSREPRTAAAAPRAAGAWRGRGTRGEGASARRPASARPVESVPRSRGARFVRPAGRRGALKSGSSTPPGERKGCAAGAGGRRSQAPRNAVPAPRSKEAVQRRRTPRAADVITTGAPVGFASTAASTLTQG